MTQLFNTKVKNKFNLFFLCQIFIGLFFIIKLNFVLNHGINFDEFAFLSTIYDLKHGEIDEIFTRGFIYLFYWMTWLPFDEVALISIGRTIALLCHLLAGYFIYKTSRLFFNKQTSILIPLLWFSFSYILLQGASFRVDPFINVLLAPALYLSLKPEKENIDYILIGTLLGFSGFLSVKSIFIATTIGIILLSDLLATDNKKTTFVKTIGTGATSVITFSILIFFHILIIGIPNNQTALNINNFGQVNDFILNPEVLRGPIYFIWAFFENKFYWMCFFISLFFIAHQTYKEKNIKMVIILVAILIPLSTIFYYKNAYPYFYAYMLIPTSFLFGYLFDIILKSIKQNYQFIALFILLIPISINTIEYNFIRLESFNLKNQKNIIKQIHQVFPKKTPYLTDVGMISTYNNVGFFGAFIIGKSNYLKGVYGSIESIIKEKKPVFILSNIALTTEEDSLENSTIMDFLTDKDRKFIRDNYLPHWEGLYVAGKNINLNKKNTANFNIFVPGKYTIESQNPVKIDKKIYNPNNFIYLNIGNHSLENINYDQNHITLRWGENLYKPNITIENWELYSPY